MEDKLKYTLLADTISDTTNIWTRSEKRIWFITLWLGTCILYSTRTTMPLLMPSVAAEMRWSKTDSGTILSSFFWGYTLTQIVGGYFSDKYGGQRVILLAALGWSLLTFAMPIIIEWAQRATGWSIDLIVLIRILNGAAQGVHFPAMMSVVSQNLGATERTSFFSLLTSGSAIGTLLTGTLGSFLLDYLGWPYVFYGIGFLGIGWTLLFRYHTLHGERRRIVNLSKRMLCPSTVEPCDSVPWLSLLSHSSVWACILTHACEMNCFFVLLSWMPTYFHDTHPQAKGWIANMIPWLGLAPCTLCAKVLTNRLIDRHWPLTRVRKLIQSLCFSTQIIALLLLSNTTSFTMALTCMTAIIAGSGFHNNAATINPQDLAPTFSGSVFGLMNTVGAIPGFLGVYLAGHILELTQSWSAVFSTSIAINILGLIIFNVFGAADPIVMTPIH